MCPVAGTPCPGGLSLQRAPWGCWALRLSCLPAVLEASGVWMEWVLSLSFGVLDTEPSPGVLPAPTVMPWGAPAGSSVGASLPLPG